MWCCSATQPASQRHTSPNSDPNDWIKALWYFAGQALPGAGSTKDKHEEECIEKAGFNPRLARHHTAGAEGTCYICASTPGSQLASILDRLLFWAPAAGRSSGVRLVLVLRPAHRLMAPSTDQDKNVRGARSSKSGIEVTKSSFSSNARSLHSSSDPLHRMYHPSDHGVTTAEHPHRPNSLSTSVYPAYDRGAACYGP
jgi:hypothetical protein